MSDGRGRCSGLGNAEGARGAPTLTYPTSPVGLGQLGVVRAAVEAKGRVPS